MEDSPYIKRSEVRRLTTFSDSTLDRRETAGELPKRIKLSQRVTVWSRAAVLAWLESKVNAAQPAPYCYIDPEPWP